MQEHVDLTVDDDVERISFVALAAITVFLGNCLVTVCDATISISAASMPLNSAVLPSVSVNVAIVLKFRYISST